MTGGALVPPPLLSGQVAVVRSVQFVVQVSCSEIGNPIDCVLPDERTTLGTSAPPAPPDPRQKSTFF
jgi:hypothetical protein